MTTDQIAAFIWARFVNRILHVRVKPSADGRNYTCYLHFQNGRDLAVYVPADADEAELQELVNAARAVAG